MDPSVQTATGNGTVTGTPPPKADVARAQMPGVEQSPSASGEQTPSGRQQQQHRKHRRTASEDLGRTYDQPTGYYQYPPTQIAYNPPASPMNNGVNGFVPQAGQIHGYAQGHAPESMNGPAHHRVRSWSENPSFVTSQGYAYPAPQGFMPHPPQAFSPAGNPLVPMFADPNMQNGAAYMPPTNDQYNGSSRRKRREHRRAQSYSGGSSYGSINAFFNGEAPPTPNGPPPPLPSGRKRDFSPRSEIMKLATGMGRPQQGSSSPKALGDMRVSFSPASTPRGGGSDVEGGMGVYGMDGGSTAVPTVPFMSGSEGAGEAVFSAQKKGKHRKSPSSRKMHMRQKSAQLFMEDVKGHAQVPACRDIFFLLFFVFHLLGIVYLGNLYGYEAVRFHDEVEDSSVTIIYSNLIYVSSLSGIFAVSVSALTLLLMTALAKNMVQIALIIAISLSFAWGTIGIGLSPKKVVPATGVIALALSVAYAFIVWDRIPFAAANLNAGLNGIKSNPGAVLIGFFFQFLALGWSVYFTYVAVGVYDAIEVGTIDVSVPDMKLIIYCALGVSYYWTLHVFLNIVQVTVSGVIGSWWFTAEGDTSTRQDDLVRAFFRSSFYSIGSICYGSLLVGPVRLLRQLSVLFRPSEEVSSLMCLHECFYCIQKCLTSCVDTLADRYSPWGFTYIGLYGYGLVDAGLHSTELFEKRGWSTIVSDDLVPNVLLMTSLVIGGITGCFAHLIENFETLALTSLDEPVATSFLVGVLIGLVVSSVLFGIISSSVSAVIVCFAASPVDFEQNHPNLSQEMRTAWREVWPGCMDVVDMRVAVAAYLDPSMSGSGEHQPLLQ
eukprot:CAMPEP_0117084522 /NCGR_PEP_ID=MMETSP0472-20121206/59490_1 /TAXON_ID=693140 ORGANISM="Tiarina fusus, Strain LIS" /NCGR_SAMPLE_ID=MMETSP0472 /ASSEMBLY_ACC=CAM_ASM_000603 /LENGTH=829 /DNA_ID=CAMNT_0004813551 /DNA_START=41 /DNA_END=2531 /DNA_ORIENTATION=-